MAYLILLLNKLTIFIKTLCSVLHLRATSKTFQCWHIYLPCRISQNKNTYLPTQNYQTGLGEGKQIYLSRRTTKPTKWSMHPAKISLGIRPVWSVFAVCSGPKLSSCGQRRLQSDWADAHADLSLRWGQRSFCWSDMRRLIYKCGLNIKPYNWQFMICGSFFIGKL